MPRQIKIDVLDQDYAIAGPKIKNTSQAKRIFNQNRLSSQLDVKNSRTALDVMLSTMGITISAIDQADFSLKEDQKNIELLLNPNILQNRSLPILKKKKTKIRDKFSNEDDPFYELDEPRDSNEVIKETVDTIDQNEAVTDIARDIVALNLSNKTAVKQFRSLE